MLSQRDRTVIRDCLMLEDDIVVRGDLHIAGGVLVQADSLRQPELEIDGSQHLALPALVNPHIHLGETILRGVLPIPTLARYIGLSHGTYERPEWWDNRDAIRRAAEEVALAETIMAGIGTICTSRSWDAVARSGVRGLCGYPLCRTRKLASYYHGFPGQFLDRLASDEPVGPVHTVLYLQSLPAVEPDLLSVAGSLYRDGVVTSPLFVHLHESEREVAWLKKRYGMTGPALLDREGLLGPHAILVHAVWLDDDDLDLIAARGAAVVFCPVANLRLRVGIPPIARVSQRGIRWAIGTDGLAANDGAQPLEAVKLAALLSGLEHTPAAWRRKVTEDAADVLGLRGVTGKLDIGHSADVALFALGPGLTPTSRLSSHVIWNWPALELTALFVRGRLIADRGRPLTVDHLAAARNLDRWDEELM